MQINTSLVFESKLWTQREHVACEEREMAKKCYPWDPPFVSSKNNGKVRRENTQTELLGRLFYEARCIKRKKKKIAHQIDFIL